MICNAMLRYDKVMVADRENSRVQVFTLEGAVVSGWPAHRAVAVAAGRVCLPTAGGRGRASAACAFALAS